ncbi:MAG: DUF169 domain-containing protein [Candidatus Omnitrophica bacterium]|nr:DUF169 domain-containing protein [Candidatus Omnitrophota bacterium]
MQKEWQEYSAIFKELFGLEQSPVGVSLIKGLCPEDKIKKVRICRAILDAAAGKTFKICKENNACFGAGWHLGFHRLDNPKVEQMIKKFVVEGEKLFSSYQALDNLISQMGKVPDNSEAYFELSPLDKSDLKPQLVLFVLNPEQACRLLTLVTFIDGVMPEIKIGGPTCRMAIMYPLLTGKTNLSFYDYTARKLCNVEKDKLVISIVYDNIKAVIESIDKCSAGRAKIEYPQEFREFLQKRLVK